MKTIQRIKMIQLVVGLIGWCVLYYYLQPLADWFVDLFPHLRAFSSLHEAVRFFIFEVPKVLLLLSLIIFFVGIVRTFFTVERTRKVLAERKMLAGNVMAALLGVVTPFCSCSAIPLFLGFIEAGIPLGVTFSFLIASPMINEVAIVLLYGMFGWKIMLIYISTGLLIAIVAGWIIGRMKLEKWVEAWVYEIKVEKKSNNNEDEKISWDNRIDAGFAAVQDIVGKVWLYVMLGIAVGAGVHGYVPQNFMVSLMDESRWYSVPLSVLIGVPLYSNAAGIVPIVSVLIEKGASLGTALSFMMSVIALSLPELIILKKVLRLPLIFTFVAIVATGIILVGYLFNIIM